MYVAVKGGEKAIKNAHKLNDKKRRGDLDVPEISAKQISEQMSGAVDKVMNEGNLFDRQLGALSIKQSAGDLIEAVFLLRAYRTTLPRLAIAKPIDTNDMHIKRRVSATYKDVPGGQILGSTFDYTHRLFDFGLLNSDNVGVEINVDKNSLPLANEDVTSRVAEFLEKDGSIVIDVDSGAEPGDITVKPLTFPGTRSERLQQLIRSDEGFITSMAYAVIRGYAEGTHPYVGETRIGETKVFICPEEVGFDIDIGDIELTECEMFGKFFSPSNETPKLTRGYALTLGSAERKAMSVSIMDLALRIEDFGKLGNGPPQDVEFVMSHCDNVDADGFLSHLRLPHYVDFQADLNLLKLLKEEYNKQQAKKDC